MRDVAGVHVAVCEWTISKDRLKLYWRDASGKPIGSFARLDSIVHSHGRHLEFATNAGIFAVGQPNGVFFVAKGHATIVPSSAYAALAVTPDIATQSGPLLVSGGHIHPALNPVGPSKYVRNGVGIRADGTVVFAMARDPVNLYTFATIFRDALRCPDALYLDGAISQFYVAGDVPDTAGQFAGIIAGTTR